jgi:type IV pilus assembly protein PilY1
MKKTIKKWLSAIYIAMWLGGPGIAHATPYTVSVPRPAVPPNVISTPNKPMMMLATSKDHSLWGPVYNDFEDLEGNGSIETTFNPTFKYYGYFDSTKCYVYDASAGNFTPNSLATFTTNGRYTCSQASAEWSGNFLNWATMTRLDVVRKMLYGGKRSTDTATLVKSGGQITNVTGSKTVLERALVSKDSHSFVKFYAGTDIADYTPFTVANLTKNTGANKNVYAGLSICSRSNNSSNTDILTNGGTFPIMRMAKGNYRLWATTASRVCRWSSESGPGFSAKAAQYYKDADKGNGGISHETAAPNVTTDGASYGTIGPDLTVRVEVCKASLLGEEKCQAYPPALKVNYKPYGIFQEFGLQSDSASAARVEFGVLTGSYDENLKAGALRKNMGDFADEVNPDTGVFCHNAGGCAATVDGGRVTGNGAIKAIDAFVLFGSNGNYGGSGTLAQSMTAGGLPAWGNPIGEMIIQSYQYFAGASSTNPSSTSKDAGLGIGQQNWSDPMSTTNTTRTNLYGNPICRPMYTLALSSSALSFDGLDGNPGSDTQMQTLFNSLVNRAKSLTDYTNVIGVQEGIVGTLRSVGAVDGGWGETCSGKTVGSLADVSGICPEAPGNGGTYKVAGAALYANTAKIRNVTSPPTDLNKVQDALKVKTLTASLAGGAARIAVPIPGSANAGKYVYITPEGLWNGGGSTRLPAALLTFNSIAAGTTGAGNPYGTFMMTWNDTPFGGDYDMDLVGFLRYEVFADAASASGYSIKVTTDVVGADAGWTGLHGFSIIGTNGDQRYLTHMHNNSGLNPFVGAEGYLCGNATFKAANATACGGSAASSNTLAPVTLTFKMIGVNEVVLEDPLWYAAKYGYFPSSVKGSDDTYTDIQLPASHDAWDHYRSDGSVGQDGVPDGYFLARRPDILEQQLRRALTGLADSSNAAPATSSAQLINDGYKYTVGFSTETIAGQLEAFQLDSQGRFGTSPTWNAGAKLRTDASANAGASRNIITNSGNGTSAGQAFRWASLDSAYKTQMTTASTNVMSTANAQIVLNYMRGDQSKEGPTGLRSRELNLLGPVVNAEPWIQRPPDAITYSAYDDGYQAFFSTSANRTRGNLLWVAANDGMLHAFNPTTGAERFAYVPGVLANRLAEIPLQRGSSGARTQLTGANFVSGTTESRPTGTVWAYVDSSPFTADVKVGSTWKTYLFGALGRGGKALYALDVTTPDNLTEANAGSVFRWQFTSDDDADLGYVSMGKVLRHPATNQAMPVAKFNNGKYGIILGNGQKSDTGKAVLYILYVDGPSGGSWSGRYKKITADVGPNNGLSMPRWEDIDGNGTADIAYAGDLQGNMWKFDLRDPNDANWDVAFKDGSTNKPLYRATYVGVVGGTTVTTGLPITTPPQLIYRGQGGLIVNFGTGNAFEDADFPNTSLPQRFYGIWDRPGLGATRTLPTGLTTLKQRTLVRNASTGDVTFDTTTLGNVNWSTQDGWYVTLPNSSEMVLSSPQLSAGTLVFTSVRPKTNSTNYCSTAPEASLFAIDPISGRSDRNAQGNVTVSGNIFNIAGKDIGDQIVNVVEDRTKKPFTKECTAGEPGCTCVGASCTKPATCGPGQAAKRVVGKRADALICYNTSPRIQWREIPGLRTDQ